MRQVKKKPSFASLQLPVAKSRGKLARLEMESKFLCTKEREEKGGEGKEGGRGECAHYENHTWRRRRGRKGGGESPNGFLERGGPTDGPRSGRRRTMFFFPPTPLSFLSDSLVPSPGFSSVRSRGPRGKRGRERD